MVYMGSKRKYCKYICPIINKYIKDNNITEFYDIMCGGANLADKIECKNVYANDLSPTLIALHKQAQLDFSKIPDEGNREYWDKAYSNYKIILQNLSNDKTLEDYQNLVDMPLYEIGSIEWYASFANGGFPRGYAKNTETRNYYKEAYRNHNNQKDNENYKKINFIQGDYRNLKIPLNALVYVDSPYKNTKPYQINKDFNHEEYYNFLRELSKTNPIFISEQTMPEDFPIIWEKEVKRTAGQDNNFKACEKLYFLDNRGENKNE